MVRDRIHIDGNCCGLRQKIADRTVPKRFCGCYPQYRAGGLRRSSPVLEPMR
jgi:hypothetical protein